LSPSSAKYCVSKLRKDARVGDITDRLDNWVDAAMCGGLLQSSQLDTGSSRAVSMPHLSTEDGEGEVGILRCEVDL